MEKIVITTEEQLKQALQLRKKVFIEEQGIDENLEYDQYDNLTSDCTHVMIMDNNEVVAVGRYRIVNDTVAKLQRICVHPLYRREGYGKEIILLLEQLAKKANLYTTQLDAQIKATSFYQRLGYHEISSDIFLDAGIEHITMRKSLLTIELKNRLYQVAQLIEGQSLADIGSDHAYLPIYAIKNNLINFAIAGEVVDGPYQAACQNVVHYNMTPQIKVKKGNGLSVLENEAAVDTVTICGMGGSLIVNILEQGKMFLQHYPQLILQPNLNAKIVRQWLMSNHYQIDNELILEEDGHIYEIIVAKKGTMQLNESELLMGPYLIKQSNNIAFKMKWQREMTEWHRILQKLDANNLQHQLKITELQNKIAIVSQYI